MTSKPNPMHRIAILAIAVTFALLSPSDAAQTSTDTSFQVRLAQNSQTIPLYEVLEITFSHGKEYHDPFSDVTIDVTFTSPSGKKSHVGGFYYGPASNPVVARHIPSSAEGDSSQGADGPYLWKARFAPCETGKWKYSFVFTNSDGHKAPGRGSFRCVEGKKPNPGFLRQHPTNPFRFVFDDGSMYFPIGLQDCWGDSAKNGCALDQCSMEGPFRTDRKDVPDLPDGPLFVRGPSLNPQNADVYFRRFSQCGFDLYRFSQQNCSFALNRNLDQFLVPEGIMVDELLIYARRYGLRMMYGIFGFQKAFNDGPFTDQNVSKIKRFIKYSVDRWGAYVDFWELFNEQHAADRWYEITVPYVKSLDPYHHPVTTSWERPQLDGIEISAPHWYQRENELQSDIITARRATGYKQHKKPVIVGEQGNHINRKAKNPPGVGGVWDDRSALRMRIRNWTALFNEIAIIFWNTSYARDGHFMNIWLGPQERSYVRAMQDLAYRLDKDVTMAPVDVSPARTVRAYGLASKERAAVYLHHFDNHSEPVSDVTITLRVPKAAKGYWYSPEDASILKVIDVNRGTQKLNVPDFSVDIALLITPDGPPDIDKDGKSNHLDPDDDNDGVGDIEDAFPIEPSKWADKDHDLIGDNLDADLDGDGKGDDLNNNAIPDFEELDLDGDGVDRAKSIPWDVFPLDPKEWRDSDGDGIGDNADPDDDNDGYTDKEELNRKTDPLDNLSFPQ